jgi:3-hydroxyisobutyrate dehydrogenase-like beta-hydroxyacid dehydrogenase
MSTNATTVGLIGVGLMGHGIATNILKAGYPLAFLSHPGNQPTDDLIALGANTQPHVADIARTSQIIILCVTGTPALEAILYRDGLLNAIKPGTVIIDCSTAMPSSTLRIAHDVHAKGGQFMDAPMTRTPKEAAQGRLNLIVGATPELFAHCTPLLRSFAENIVHAGPVGSGHRMKLIHNFVSLGFAAVVSEAAACAHDAGIDSDVLLQVLSKGGGDGVVLNRLKPYIETRDNSGFYFSLSNAMKDMTYYDDMAMESGAAHTVANAVKVSYAFAASQDPEAKVPDLMGMLLKNKPQT